MVIVARGQGLGPMYQATMHNTSSCGAPSPDARARIPREEMSSGISTRQLGVQKQHNNCAFNGGEGCGANCIFFML